MKNNLIHNHNPYKEPQMDNDASKSYTGSSIQELSPLEHLRLNPAMYIGDSDTPTHLLYEILDNALDEANAKYASLVLVKLDLENGIYTVADNGRGIPFDNNALVKVATKMFSGGKFKKGEDSAYGAAIGLHGIGMFAVTALSEWVKITVYRDNKKVYYKFVDCKVAEEKIEDFDTTKRPASTVVEFKPDKKYFDDIKVNVDRIRMRLQLASVHIDQLRLIFINGETKEVIKMSMQEHFDSVFWKKCDKDKCTPVYEVTKTIKGEQVRIIFGWDMSSYSQPILGGTVNLLPVDLGSHINGSLSILKTVFESISKKEKLNWNVNDYRIGLRMYVAAQLYKPGYTSQTKEKLEDKSHTLDPLLKDLDKEIEKKLRENDEMFQRLIMFTDSYRSSLNAKGKIIKSQKGNVTRFTQSLDSKLKDCSSTDVSKCEIFITEGDSASGGLVQCRDTKYHAILGLKGKIPNLTMGNKDFLKNKELCELINALGCGIGKDFDISSLRYSKVCVTTDGDSDGAHIASLIVTALLKLIPGLYHHHKIYRVIMPLYGVKSWKGKFLPFWTTEEMLEFKKQNPKVQITRYKGLGEMNPPELAACVLDPETRKLQEICDCDDDEAQEIFKMMSDVQTKRDMLNDEE